MYANDCIEIEQRERTRGLKRIEEHSSVELNAAVESAHRRFGTDFWMLLHGIDAYMERRRRRSARRQSVQDRLAHLAATIEDNEHIWGNG